MEKTQKYVIGGIIVIALVAAWQFSKKPDSPNINQSANQGEEQELNSPENVGAEGEIAQPSENQAGENQGNAWEGSLKLSDNPAKGNLLLMTKDRVIYIRTSRDYSALVDKEVKVTYEGTLESFRLGDIVEK